MEEATKWQILVSWSFFYSSSTNVTADQLAKAFVSEVEIGISGTSIKAGVLKSASDVGGITPLQEIGLRGVARAHNKTGVPIENQLSGTLDFTLQSEYMTA